MKEPISQRNTMSKLFLIDFDHTLFDNDQLKQAISNELQNIVSDPTHIEELWQTIRSFRHAPFHIQEGIKKFCENHQLIDQREQIYQAFLNQNFSSFIYSDSITGLQQLSEYGEIALFTTGDGLYQQVKIQQSSLSQYLKTIYIFDNKMENFLEVAAHYPNTEIWFIDNQLLLLEKASQMNNAVKTVWIKREDYAKESQFQPTVTVANLSELIEYLNLKIVN